MKTIFYICNLYTKKRWVDYLSRLKNFKEEVLKNYFIEDISKTKKNNVISKFNELEHFIVKEACSLNSGGC